LTVVYTGVTGTAVPYISQGNGKFTKGSPRSAGDSPMAAAWGDFNKDGFGDIAAAQERSPAQNSPTSKPPTLPSTLASQSPPATSTTTAISISPFQQTTV